jgi:hypothetical protein
MIVLTRTDFYPPHLTVGNLYTHVRKGVETVGRHITCRVCNINNNNRSRNGDARFIRLHKHCGFAVTIR